MHSNHFKLCGSDLSSFLSNLFSSFLSHGYLFEKILRGEIKPIIKENLGKLDDSSNYRPITISSDCLTIFEYCMLGHLKNRLKLNPRQFGFCNGTSTTIAALILKETIMSYTHKRSKVYALFYLFLNYAVQKSLQ